VRRWIPKAATVASVALLASLIAPGLAQAESLSLSFATKPTLGEPLGIVAEVEADGSHGLFVYVQPGGQVCAFDPAQEASERAGVVTLSSAGGDPLSAGSFLRTYDYTPEAENIYSVCAYLDQTATDAPPPGGIANAEFPIPSEPAGVPTPKEQEELKAIAVAHEHQEELERAKRAAEQAERERPLPTAVHSPEAPPKAPAASTVRCAVPSLLGHSLTAARSALRRDHCKLGAVKRPRHAHGKLVVVRQSVKRGSKLREDTAVAVLLGAAKHSR
jgi:hypothetical protein